MAADELVVISAGPVLGEIQSRGLLDREGRPRCRISANDPGVAAAAASSKLRSNWKLTASRPRTLGIPTMPPDLPGRTTPPTLPQRQHGQRADGTHADRIAALPRYCRGKQRTTLLCGGLPYHRRFGPRKFDTLLVVQGETARTFRLGIGIDVPHPMAAAPGFSVAAAFACPISRRRHRRPAGFSISIAATCWRPTGSRLWCRRLACIQCSRDGCATMASASACWRPTAAACGWGFAVSGPWPPHGSRARRRAASKTVGGRRPNRDPAGPAPVDGSRGAFHIHVTPQLTLAVAVIPRNSIIVVFLDLLKCRDRSHAAMRSVKAIYENGHLLFPEGNGPEGRMEVVVVFPNKASR